MKEESNNLNIEILHNDIEEQEAQKQVENNRQSQPAPVVEENQQQVEPVQEAPVVEKKDKDGQ